MVRRSGPLVGVALALMVFAGEATGCSGTNPPLRPALEELASVGGPEGEDAFDLAVVECEDGAEVRAGYASYHHAALETSVGEARNAEFARVTAWYLPRWRTLGWKADPASPGSAVKHTDGGQLRAAIDVGKGTGYAIVVIDDGDGQCSRAV